MDVAAIVAKMLASRAGARGGVDPNTALILESVLVGAARETDGLAPYVSVETLAVGGRFHHLCVTDRFPLAPPLLETGMLLPSCLGAAQQAGVTTMAEQALRALNFRHGAAHTELMLTSEGPRVIEVNARVGGAVPFLLPIAAGYDVVTQIGRLAWAGPGTADLLRPVRGVRRPAASGRPDRGLRGRPHRGANHPGRAGGHPRRDPAGHRHHGRPEHDDRGSARRRRQPGRGSPDSSADPRHGAAPLSG